MKLDTVLVPLDGSVLAEGALPKAVELAEASVAGLLLLRAAHAHTLPGVDPTAAQVEVVREAEQYLAEVRDRLGKSGLKKVEASVWYGPAAYAIVEAARLYRVDQIVMSTHGRTGFEQIMLGSVTAKVVARADCPVLSIRPAKSSAH